ncbi:hypothetical protein H5410_043363 [Solanum commersonii]|uniref:Uncharacterized protein n=1 Tax=Solanum commersonii TaxID=4109 RepID=A0A9J5XXC4_SOLCO|nr:hypothetical protein H5410_043363 [Solanum commersonii]
MIILCKAEVGTMNMITETLRKYEEVSGQKQAQRMMAQFFWSNCIGGKGRHWTRWSNLCLPEKEGGIGFRLMQDISMALFCKLWWNFRTKTSGSTYVWHDNWTGLGNLYTIIGDEVAWDDEYKRIDELAKHGEWDIAILHELLPQELVEHIVRHIQPPGRREDEWTKLREVIILWWKQDVKNPLRPYYIIVPSFIVWELWRRRNRMKHEGKKTSLPRVIHNVTRNMYMMMQSSKPSMRCPSSWPEIITVLENYYPRMKVKQVIWEFPPEGWVKYNTEWSFQRKSRH